jgi:hypothetical protein
MSNSTGLAVQQASTVAVTTGINASETIGTTKSWRDWLPIHPEADKYPRLDQHERTMLGNDIKENGLKKPVEIVRDENNTGWQLVDGRNRLDAMEDAGIDIRFGDRTIFKKLPPDRCA